MICSCNRKLVQKISAKVLSNLQEYGCVALAYQISSLTPKSVKSCAIECKKNLRKKKFNLIVGFESFKTLLPSHTLFKSSLH